MGYHQHLRNQLLQNSRPKRYIVIKWNSVSNHDVLYGIAYEAWTLSFLDYSSYDYATCLSDSSIHFSFRIFLYDLYVAIRIFLWNIVWIT